MSELRRDEIIYEEGWRDAKVEAPLPDEARDEENKLSAEPEKPENSRPLLTILQLVLCMLTALALFILKAMDSGAYHSFMQTVDEEMSKPVISQKLFDAVDWNALFGADPVKVTATSDELPNR